LKFLILLLIPCFLLADKAAVAPPDASPLESPWLTGPLLAPASVTLPAGHYNVEPYLYAYANIGDYNQHWHSVSEKTLWSFSSQTLLQFGLTSFMDFQFNPTFQYNYTEGAGNWSLGDLPVIVDFQLYTRGLEVPEWLSNVKLVLQETFPLGKYQNLDPKKELTDMGGKGSFQTTLGLVWGNLFYLGGVHFLSSRFYLQYTLPAPVSVKGFNAYGGGYGTRGTVYPAQNFTVDLGLELTVTQKWALALDLVGVWGAKTRFKGDPGYTAEGAPAKMTAPSSIQYSLAPAVEYNWSNSLGAIAGAWFTVAGRNSIQFCSAVIAINYYK
jgi:hypothetical protein